MNILTALPLLSVTLTANKGVYEAISNQVYVYGPLW